MVILVIIMSSSISGGIVAPDPISASSQQKWFVPNYFSKWHDLKSTGWGDYFTTSSQLTQTLLRINVFGLPEVEIKRNQGNFLHYLIPLLKKYHVAIATEGRIETCDKDSTAWVKYTLNDLVKPVYDHGGTVAYFSFEAFPAALFHCPNRTITIDQAVNDMANFMSLFHKVHPETKFGLLANFPNYGYGNNVACTGGIKFSRGDYKVLLETIIKGIQNKGGQLSFVHADNPYDYATGEKCREVFRRVDATPIDWMGRIVALESQVESHPGLRFGLIYNSATPGDMGSDKQYYLDTLAYITAFKARGGNPDDMVIESWYKYPSALFPDSTPYTFTYLIKQVFPKN